jgi:thiol-disulfide isomerase/thioredoxin
MRTIELILFLLCVNIIFAQSNIKINSKAPEIIITDWIENVPADKNLNSKNVVLEFWATWCGPCIAAVPHMNKIQKELKNEDVYFVSITDESVGKVKKILKRIDFASIVVSDQTKQTQVNFGDGIKGLETFPLTVIIDDKGIVKWIGEPKELSSKMISNLLSLKLNTETNKINKLNKDLENLSFKALVNSDLSEYFNITRAEKNIKIKRLDKAKNIIELKAHTLNEIYGELFSKNENQLQIPFNLKDIKFDLIYKSEASLSYLDLLENKILNTLNLKKEVDYKLSTTNNIHVNDISLLEETLEKKFSYKSEADDKIIFTAYTIKDMLEEMSNELSVEFRYEGDNNAKYDFIINMTSLADAIKDLKSYGLNFEESKEKIEFIKLYSSNE